MKKIIKNRVYDTDKATKLGEWENMSDVSNFGYVCESLYIKRTGEYFLHGEGGPQTRYSKAVGSNTWTWGESIMPLSYDDARKWAEEYLGSDEYERAFGVIEDETEVVLSVRVSAATKDKLDKLAAQSGRTKGDVLAELLAKA